MAPTIGKPETRDFGFYIVIILVAAAVWQAQGYMTSRGQRQLLNSPDGIVGTAITELNGIQKLQLDAYLGMNSLLTTFGTTLLGALGFLLFGKEKTRVWTRHRWAVYLGVLCVAVSIFFGYVAYLFLLMKLRDVLFAVPFDVTSGYPHWAQQAHFYTFLAGVVFLADFVYQNLLKESGREIPPVTVS